MRGDSTTRRMAFTLIELLVVVAIIALLVSILLPSLSAAREQARAAKCGSHLRGFGSGLHTYTTENKEWLPGVNTTGVPLRIAVLRNRKEELRRPDLPAQTFDWLSPLLRGETTDLGRNRAERFARLVNDDYRCPSQTTTNSIIYRTDFPDAEDFRAIGEWRAISYLMPAAFQLFGTSLYEKHILDNFSGRPIYAYTWPRRFETDTRDYVARISRVGPPARKIAVTDGTRYLARNGELDHDVVPDPGLFFGSFTDGGAWWCGSTAYGVGVDTSTWDGRRVPRGSPSDGRNLALTYRHGSVDRSRVTRSVFDNKGAINALFFDGHVARLTDRESRRIEYWYPTDSVVTASGRAEGMELAEQGFKIP